MRSRLAGALLVVASVLALLAVGPAQQMRSAGAAAAAPTLRGFEHGLVAYHSETGEVRIIGSAPGKPIARPSGLERSAAPATVARAFLARHAPPIGIRDQAEDLHVTSVETAPAGRAVVRFQQVYGGVPVLGGELVVNLDRDGNLLSLSGEVLPAPDILVVPRVTPSSASAAALGTVAKARGVPVSRLRASEPSLWIYDPRIMGGPGLPGPVLVWRTDVTAGPREPVDELVLVDARLGSVALHFDQVREARNRQVCDAGNTTSQVPCTVPVRTEGGPASAIPDVNYAYDYSGDTYDFFATLGRDSIDGAGMALKSTTRYCPEGKPCPYENAVWNGEQMVYGDGYAAADDVVGHELTHGVTERSSHLFYYYQSGAIDESLSDTFGEFVDLTNGKGTDTAATRWKLGEDLPGGAIRDMKDPSLEGQPDRMTSPYYTADPSEEDRGGVHTNSGVGNKAAYLITDGGTFNGQTVTGLGITKAARIYYEVDTNLLTSGSDYADLAFALQQGCTNLVGTGGITSSDCAQVAKAVQAVEMTTVPPAAPNPEARGCETGLTLHHLFFDSLENPASGNWTKQTGSGTNGWYYPQNPNPYIDATYATSGKTNFWGYDVGAPADYSIAMTRSVLVPSGSTAYFRFDHAFSFEGVNYDGGVVEHSTDAGATWNDVGPLFTDNGYSGTIATYGNPLGGRGGFVGGTYGYISSRAGLSTLGGQLVRFRFRIGTDVDGDDLGWFVDDIRIYTCTAPGLNPPGAPAGVVATAGNASAQVAWAAPAVNGGSAVTNYVVTPYAGAVAQAPTAVGAVTSATVGGLTNGTTYTFMVSAANVAGVGPESAASAAVTPKANQAISFGSLPGKTYGDPDFTVSATASSGLPVSFAAGGSCTVSGATVHLAGAGTCTITASQAGSTGYNAASVSQSFAIAKASQTLGFGSLSARTYGDPDFTLSATASSGLPVTFTASGSCTVAGSSVHLTGSGSCTLTASQGGDANFNPAASVSRSFSIAQPKRPAKIVCRVPKVTGKTLAAAKSAIAKSHCRTGAVTQAYSNKIAKGKVISQSRTAGKVLAANTKINLVVSRGAKKKR